MGGTERVLDPAVGTTKRGLVRPLTWLALSSAPISYNVLWGSNYRPTGSGLYGDASCCDFHNHSPVGL